MSSFNPSVRTFLQNNGHYHGRAFSIFQNCLEKILLIQVVLLRYSLVERLREVFRNFDSDQSGLLNVEELQAVLGEMSKPEHVELIRTLLKLKGIPPEIGLTFLDFVKMCSAFILL